MKKAAIALIVVVAVVVAIGIYRFESADGRLARAQVLLDENRTGEAITELRLILRNEADHELARIALLDAYIRTGNGASAMRQIDWLTENGSQLQLDDSRLAALIALGEYEQVVSRTATLDEKRASARAMNLRAWSFYQLGEYESARQAYDAFLKVFPDSLDAQLGLARVAIRVHDATTASQHVMPVLEGNPGYGDAWLVFGDLLLEMRRYPEAEQAFSRARSLLANHLNPAVGTARALLGQGSLRDAGVLIGALRQDFKNSAEVKFLAATLAEAEDRPDDALLLYQQIVAARPRDHASFTRIGAIAYRKGNTATAQSNLQAAINISAGRTDARLLLAEIERQAGRHGVSGEILSSLFADPLVAERGVYALCSDGATELTYEEFSGLLEHWLAEHPGDIAARLTLAVETDNQGFADTAITHYREIVDADPDHALALARLASLDPGRVESRDSGAGELDDAYRGRFRCSR